MRALSVETFRTLLSKYCIRDTSVVNYRQILRSLITGSDRNSSLMSNQWTKVVLFGDSLSQGLNRQTGVGLHFWPTDSRGLPSMTKSFLTFGLNLRISDVLVRGFSGYNSRWLRMIAPKVLSVGSDGQQISCLTILIGANDANDSDSPGGQHVPIDEYEENLIKIVDYFESTGVPKERMVLISPPIYVHHMWSQYCRDNGKPESKKTNETVGQYAKACGSAAQRSGVQFLDLFEEFSKQDNWDQLFCDGLHFSRKGSQLVFELIWPLVEKRVKLHKSCNELTMNFPIYSDIDVKYPEKSLSE